MDENDLREVLRDYAASYRPTGRLPDRPAGVPPRRRRRALAVVPALAAAAAAAVVIGSQAGSDVPAGSSVASGTPGDPVIIMLAGYAAPKGHTLPNPLQRHLACMREHGYALPDPTWTGHGWMLTVTEGRALGVGGKDWKQTAFVTCALTRPGHDGLPGLHHALLHPRPRHSGTGHR
jgi:hypothetical protein